MKANGRVLLLAVLFAGCGGGEGFEEASTETASSEDAESLMSPLTDDYLYKSSCPANGGRGVVDKWRFYQCECTSYATYKLRQRGVKFQNDYKGEHFGNASNWKNAAKAAGISVSGKAKKGDIAWFSSGHVAFVEAVNSDGTVRLSEYNWSRRHDYGERSKVKADAYIHF